MKLSFGLALVAVLLNSGIASAQKKFGEVGAISPLGAVAFSYSKYSPPSSSNSESSTVKSLLFMPGAMYFIAENLAVGGQVSFGYSSVDDSTATTYGIAPAIGYNVPINDLLSLFPEAALVYQMGSSDDYDTKEASLAIDVPLLVHANNFFVGIGPNFYVDLMSKASSGGESTDASKATMFGVTSVIGGNF